MKQGIFLILAVVAAAACTSPSGLGTLQIKFTDQAHNVSSLVLQISEIQIHKAVGEASSNTVPGEGLEENETSIDNWITLSRTQGSIDLISVKDIKDIFGESQLEPGLYTQVRLLIDSAQATVDGNLVNVTVPSRTLRFSRAFYVEANKTTSLIIDFDADKSLVRANDKYILKPVAQMLREFEGKAKEEADSIKNTQASEAQQIISQRNKSGAKEQKLESSTTFSQGGMFITLQSPLTGDTQIAGSMQTLNWSSSGVNHYQLWYTTDSNLQCGEDGWTLLQSHPYYQTSFNWNIPTSLDSNFVRVRIEGHNYVYGEHVTVGYTCSGEFSVLLGS